MGKRSSLPCYTINDDRKKIDSKFPSRCYKAFYRVNMLQNCKLVCSSLLASTTLALNSKYELHRKTVFCPKKLFFNKMRAKMLKFVHIKFNSN
jgi:hypothetical protein